MNKNENNNIREVLKSIPSVDQLISYCSQKVDLNLPYPLVKKIIRDKLKEIRKDILNSKLSNSDIEEYCFNLILKEITEAINYKLNNLINGTGIVLHTGFGRAPIDKKLLYKSIDRVYPYSNLEYIIKDNKRGERNCHIDYLINSFTGSESSLIVNNNAAAVLLVLNTFSKNKEVIISRGELVEIGGSFRIPEVIEQSNCTMVEVGSTNKTHLKDFKKAINKNTGMIMIAHTSNYKVVGFTKSVVLQEIIKLAKTKRIPIFLDLGSGALIDYEKYGLPKERLVNEYIKLGVDIISFSGDKLIGGPQAGIICAKKRFIKQMYSNSMYRALRCNKFTISIMESILRTYLNNYSVSKDNLTFKLLTRTRKQLMSFGNKILVNVDNKLIKKYNIKLVESFVQAGSGSLPIENIESIALAFKSNMMTASNFSNFFRKSKIPIIGYIRSNIFYIDLKAIPSTQIKNLIESINYLAR